MLKLYLLEEDGRFKEQLNIECDKEESKAAHRCIYHIPDVLYTRIRPPKVREGLERFFINNHWGYREIVEDIEDEPND